LSDTHDSQTPSPRDLKALIEAERRGIPFVYWRDGTGEQRILMLDPHRRQVRIGRREQSDIPLTWDPEVSRTHAVLEPVGQEWTLVDDGLSRNGSFVNGSRVVGRRRLHNEDRLFVGNTRITFRETPDGQTGQSTARAHEGPSSVPLSETKRKVLLALCRPLLTGASETPATNVHIASEVYLSVDAVKAHLRELFDSFGLAGLPQNEKRTRLASTAISAGIVTPRDV
jgi:hypothetical protein